MATICADADKGGRIWSKEAVLAKIEASITPDIVPYVHITITFTG